MENDYPGVLEAARAVFWEFNNIVLDTFKFLLPKSVLPKVNRFAIVRSLSSIVQSQLPTNRVRITTSKMQSE